MSVCNSCLNGIRDGPVEDNRGAILPSLKPRLSAEGDHKVRTAFGKGTRQFGHERMSILEVFFRSLRVCTACNENPSSVEFHHLSLAKCWRWNYKLGGFNQIPGR